MFIWYIVSKVCLLHKRILMVENGIDNAQFLADKLGANGYIVDLLDSL